MSTATVLAPAAPRVIDSKKAFLQGLVVGVVATALSYGVALAIGWLENPDGWTALEAFAVFTSYVCTYMCVKESRFNYPIGAVSTASYFVLFLHFDLLASAFLNLYLVFQLMYGWVRWRSDTNSRKVQHVELKWIPAYIAVTALFYGGAVLIFHLADAKMATADSVILVGTILAQFLLDNKKVETWLVWAVVNVAAIYTYFNADLNLAGFQYILFLLNTVYGYYIWNSNKVAKEVDA